MAAGVPRPRCHGREQRRPANAFPITVEHNVGSTPLRAQLRPDSVWLKRAIAARARRTRLAHSAPLNLGFSSGREDFEAKAWRCILVPLDAVSQGAAPATFAREPERSHQRDLGPTVRSFALYCTRPKICDRTGTVGIGWIESAELSFGVLFDLRTRGSQLTGEPVAVSRYILQHCLEDHARHWIEVAGVRLAAEPQRLQWDGATACERIDDYRRIAMRRTNERARRRQIICIVGAIPIGDVANETQECVAQPCIVAVARPAHVRQITQCGPRVGAKCAGAIVIGWIRQKQRQQHRARGRERPACPPQMQRRRVPVPYRFLARGGGDREIDLGEALAGGRDHLRLAFIVRDMPRKLAGFPNAAEYASLPGMTNIRMKGE
jgi:hypothetical protein